jgi:hypothetical protein
MFMDPYAPEFVVQKEQAAHWQLSAAIRFHFTGENPILVLALASAAGEVFTDLVRHHAPEKSWDRHARNVHGLTERAYNAICRTGHNFLKHADRDPNGQLRWAIRDTEALMMLATLNAGELAGGLSPIELVYRDWYLALNMGGDTEAPGWMIEANARFPGIRTMSTKDQRAFGWLRARELEAELASD